MGRAKKTDASKYIRSDHFTWEPTATVSRKTLQETKTCPKLTTFKKKSWKCDAFLRNDDERKRIDDILCEEMYTWTTFFHMCKVAQEILWLVDLADFFKNSDEEKIDYVQRRGSVDLRTYIEKKGITSTGALIRLYFRANLNYLMNPDLCAQSCAQKVEFCNKRKLIRQCISDKITKLKMYELDDDSQLVYNLLVNSRWFVCERVIPIVKPFEKGDTVYVADRMNSIEEDRVQFYKGEVLGRKKDAAFYNVFFKCSNTIERVYQDCLWTKSEYNRIAKEVKQNVLNDQTTDSKVVSDWI